MMEYQNRKSLSYNKIIESYNYGSYITYIKFAIQNGINHPSTKSTLYFLDDSNKVKSFSRFMNDIVPNVSYKKSILQY